MDRENEHGLTRRQVLQGVGAAGLAGVVGTRPAGAKGRGPLDRHIVGVDPGKADVAKREADEVHRTLDFDDIGEAVAGWFPDDALDGLRNNPHVRYVEEEGEVEAIGQALSWGADRVDADVLHNDGETGDGADIAVIDTGIDDDHPDLEANVGSGKAYVDCSGSNCNYDWSDDNDHGTHCAGIADAVDNSEGLVGVSTQATLHAVKVLADDGSGYWSDVAAGVEYTANEGWDVGSMSLGASSGSSTVKDACQYAYDKGVLLVAAVGNDGPCSDCVGYPAAYETVMGISSTDSDDSLSSFSSTGPEIELAAPGGSIYSTVIDDYATYSGTSMACPHVSGACGQLMANGYTNTEARDQLKSTAEDIGLGDNEQGNGLLDAEAAVSGGSDSDSAPSVSWVNPGDGDTVSGTITVQIDASDSEDGDDSLDVSYSVDGGSSRSTSYNSDSGYYEDSWDTSAVSDGDHALEASATDSAGNTTSSSLTVTTDNTESAPTVDSLSLSEVETSNSDAEFDADWSVSDDDGDLDSLDLTLTDDTDGETEETVTVSVSGSSDSGTTRLVAAGDNGSGNSYTVDATVTDSYGTTGSDTTSVSETEETDSAPAIDSFSASTRTTGPWFRAESDWTVSDTDGDLDSVTTELLDSGGSVLDGESSNLSGSSASGTHKVRTRSNDADSIRLTVTDGAGNSTSDSRSV